MFGGATRPLGHRFALSCSAEAAEPQAGSSPVAQESSSGETKTPETCSAIPTEHAGHCTAESQHLDAVAMLMDARVVDTGPALGEF